MSLKKKIILSFVLSAFLIALLAVFVYANFVAIRNEIRFLELTDTIRSKSLQLRRHEKNFFLYSPDKAGEESKEVHRYLGELEALLAGGTGSDRADVLPALRERVRAYRKSFDAVGSLLGDIMDDLRALRASDAAFRKVYPLVEIAVHERPLQAAECLRTAIGPARHRRLFDSLSKLDGEIASLRKTGEDIIAHSKELDRTAREKVETGIRMSQAAILIIVPLFLASGVVMLFFTTRNVVSRLRLLMDVMEKTGKGDVTHIKAPVKSWGNDEVGQLIRKFDDMEDELEERQAEIERQNRELLQNKKLAAIGTLAAGVAHELNNPLNNIYLSTQVLMREIGGSAHPRMQEITDEILSQTVRVKKIVGDLLEFARGREPHQQDIELNALLRGVINRFRTSAGQVAFTLSSDEEHMTLRADPDQLEQVFINLFTNAVDALSGRGEVRVRVTPSDSSVRIRVSDTGKGIPKDALEKIFEPFFTMKEKGVGLGLAIVYNIIAKHGGDIMVESEEGKGTTFTVTLPRGDAGREEGKNVRK